MLAFLGLLLGATAVGAVHNIPRPYHTTDELMLAIHALAKGCNTHGDEQFKLEFVSSSEAMDLEMKTDPIPHGKSDTYFDKIDASTKAGSKASLSLSQQLAMQKEADAAERPPASTAQSMNGNTAALEALKQVKEMTLHKSDAPSAPMFSAPTPNANTASFLEMGDIGPQDDALLSALQPEGANEGAGESKRRALPDELGAGALVQEAPANQLPAGWSDKSTPPTELPVLHVSLGPNDSGEKKDTAFIMFGEHGREFISGEIGLTFIQSLHSVLCSDTPSSSSKADAAANLVQKLGAPVTAASTAASPPSTQPVVSELLQTHIADDGAAAPIIMPTAADAASLSVGEGEHVPRGESSPPRSGSQSDEPKAPEPAAAAAANLLQGADGSAAVSASAMENAEPMSLTALLEIDSSMYTTGEAYSVGQIKNLLNKWDLTIMPLVSPSAREKAEKSSFCNRKNSNGVDVNRNYPFHFGEGTNDPESDQFAGVKPLSEPETRIAARLAMDIHPKLFIAVHSGAAMVVTSPAYRPFEMKQLPVGMQKVVEGIQQRDCTSCQVGPASQVLSYLAYGCSMDYMFEEGFSENGDPASDAEEHFAFTFETWQGDERKQAAVPDASIRAEFGEHADEMIKDEHSFYALKGSVPDKEYHCLLTFNPPPTKVASMQTQWTKALYSTMDSVNKELVAKRSSK